MKTAKELVEEINAAAIVSPRGIDEVIDMKGITKIDTIDQDEHRWYTIGTVVFKVGDEFFGVSGPVHLNSESMTYADCDWKCVAFEMEAVPSVTYKAKVSP